MTDKFISAAKKGDIETVKMLVQQNPAIMSFKCKRFGETALHCAAFFGHLEIIKFLVEQSFETTNAITNSSRQTALHQAAGRRASTQLDIVKFLVEKNPQLMSVQDALGETALHHAASQGNLDVVKFLAEANPKIVSVQDLHGNTALHASVIYGNLKGLKALINAGSDTHAKNINGDTPLMLAQATYTSEIDRAKDNPFVLEYQRKRLAVIEHLILVSLEIPEKIEAPNEITKKEAKDAGIAIWKHNIHAAMSSGQGNDKLNFSPNIFWKAPQIEKFQPQVSAAEDKTLLI